MGDEISRVHSFEPSVTAADDNLHLVCIASNNWERGDWTAGCSFSWLRKCSWKCWASLYITLVLSFTTVANASSARFSYIWPQISQDPSNLCSWLGVDLVREMTGVGGAGFLLDYGDPFFRSTGKLDPRSQATAGAIRCWTDGFWGFYSPCSHGLRCLWDECCLHGISSKILSLFSNNKGSSSMVSKFS